MDRIPENPEIEERIAFEIVVDAYDEYERAVGWRCYFDDNLQFPFKAECIAERQVSPLEKGEKVEVIGMVDEGDELGEMFVEIKWKGRKMGVPLTQISPINADEETVQAVETWHYWKARGYCF
jgi:hypothetical protein